MPQITLITLWQAQQRLHCLSFGGQECFLGHVAVARALLLQVDKSLEARWGQENLMNCKTSVWCISNPQFLILKIALKILFFSLWQNLICYRAKHTALFFFFFFFLTEYLFLF